MILLSQIQNRLVELIKLSGLSQTELANRLGIKQQTVSQYLSGRAMPALDTFANICATLDASADYLLGLEDETGAKYVNSFNNSFNNTNGSINIK